MPEWSAWPFPPSDPYPAYRDARARAQVSFEEGLGAWMVLSHEHGAAVLKDTRWSSDPRNNPRLLAALGDQGALAEVWSRSLLMSDPPTHTRLRAAVNRFFTPRAVRSLRGRVASIVASAIEPLEEGESIDVMGELAYPIPLGVIAELFDVGIEGAEMLRTETPKLARLLELDSTPEQLDEVAEGAMALMFFLVPIVAQRRRDPGDDLLSALIHPPSGGAPLETDEIVTMCLLLLAAGHETTANLIANGLLALFEHQGSLDWIAANQDLTNQAVDELVRYDSPVQVISRVAKDELELAGRLVPAGAQALVVLGSANRDETRYQEPDTLDLSRPGPPHLAFGNGLHFCVGAGLARLEAAEAFARLARSPLRPVAGTWRCEWDDSRTFRRMKAFTIART